MSKSVVFLCVFARSNGGNVEKCRVFVCFLGKVEKCRVFVCFWFLCVFARSKGGNVEKCRVCRKCRVFVCFLGKVSRWAPPTRVHNLLYNIYMCINSSICIYIYI